MPPTDVRAVPTAPGVLERARLRLRRRDGQRPPGVVGRVRLDRRTRSLTSRLRPGEIAVVDHVDLDRISADQLVACRVGAVVNAALSTSGRYPNLGPEILVAAGIPLLDGVGDGVFGELREGDEVRLHGDELFVGDRVVARGVRQDAASVAAAMAEARAGLATQLEAFAANTAQYLLEERDLLLDGVGFPDLRTGLQGRHAVVVVRGYDHREDLRLLRPYLREHRPVLIGVDGGADELVLAGHTPDLVVGDPDTMSDEVLRCGAEVVVHACADGFAPALERVQDLGVPAVVFPAGGTSEDLALLLADEGGAQVIVTVGTHATLAEFLDRGRQGNASTFLTRLRVGGKLVDARAASRLHRSRISAWSLVALVLATVLVMAAALYGTSVGAVYRELLADVLASFWFWAGDLP
jgi:uncharacterized membrane-anchored protein